MRIPSVMAFILALGATASAQADPRYIVVFHEGVDVDEASAELGKRHGAPVETVYKLALRGFAGPLGAKAARAIAEDPRVKSVEADGVASIDAQQIPSGVTRIGGLLSSTAAIDGKDTRVDVDIAVIDTGVLPTHPDLNVVVNVGLKRGVFVAGAGKDDNGHGTHVAGTAAALDNATGVVGVAPGARIWAVKVLGRNGSGSYADIIAGIDYVTAHAKDIEVANMSLGGPVSTALNLAVANSVASGVTYAVAAGNSAKDAKDFSPASEPSAITVAALDESTNKLASFSNFGALVDVIAPGVNVNSTYITVKGSATYATLSGTSMASPHVAGAAALYRATHPTAAPADVVGALKGSSTETVAGYPLINVTGY